MHSTHVSHAKDVRTNHALHHRHSCSTVERCRGAKRNAASHCLREGPRAGYRLISVALLNWHGRNCSHVKLLDYSTNGLATRYIMIQCFQHRRNFNTSKPMRITALYPRKVIFHSPLSFVGTIASQLENKRIQKFPTA